MAETFLSQFLHRKRVLLIFSKSRDADTYYWQKSELDQYGAQLEERNVEVFYLFASEPQGSEHMPDAATTEELRQKFDIHPDTFTALLLDTDGREKLRDNRPVAAQALLSIIDVLPSRKKELEE